MGEAAHVAQNVLSSNEKKNASKHLRKCMLVLMVGAEEGRQKANKTPIKIREIMGTQAITQCRPVSVFSTPDGKTK